MSGKKCSKAGFRFAVCLFMASVFYEVRPVNEVIVAGNSPMLGVNHSSGSQNLSSLIFLI